MLKQQLSQKLLQKLSPQQIQLMKLLQVPTAILDQRIQEELEQNPALEEGNEYEDSHDHYEESQTSSDNEQNDEIDYESESIERQKDDSFEEYLNNYMDDEPGSYQYSTGEYGSGDESQSKTMPYAVESSFHDNLNRQIGLLKLKDEKQLKIAQQIIGSIDDDGYLRREANAIIDDLLFSQNIVVTEKEILELLYKIQSFDPPGVGARTLQECLLLQIRVKIKIATSKIQLKVLKL